MPETLPFDIIMKILKMRPRDSQMKSPTAELIEQDCYKLYEVTRYGDEDYEGWQLTFSFHYFRFRNYSDDDE